MSKENGIFVIIQDVFTVSRESQEPIHINLMIDLYFNSEKNRHYYRTFLQYQTDNYCSKFMNYYTVETLRKQPENTLQSLVFSNVGSSEAWTNIKSEHTDCSTQLGIASVLEMSQLVA